MLAHDRVLENASGVLEFFVVANPVITIIILRAIVVSEMLAEHVVL